MIDYSEKNSGTEASEQSKEAPADSSSDVLIHVMPEQFRSGGAGQGAKSTGMAILVGGVLLMAVGGAAIYYFMFRAPALPQPQVQKPAQVATTTKAAAGSTATPSQVASSTQASASSSSLNTVTATTTATTTGTVPVAVPSVNSAAPTPSADTDRDGLTDDEEAALGSDKDSQDSDGDGFGDLVELQRGYDPAGPGKLISNSKIKLSNQKSFTMVFPSAWTEKNTGGDYLMMWQAPDNQMVQVNTEKLTDPTTIVDWYKTRFSVSEIPADRIITKKDEGGTVNWSGIKSGDGLVIYFLNSKNGELYTLSYNPGLDSVIRYPNLFQAMVDSLTLK